MRFKQMAARLQLYGRSRLRNVGYDLSRVAPVRYVSWAPMPSEPPWGSMDRLEALRSRYRGADPEVTDQSYWNDRMVTAGAKVVDDRFRDESLYVWQYIRGDSSASLREAEYRYFTYLTHLERRDADGLLSRVEEDGAFGAPMFSFPGRRPVSRDVLDSVNEIAFLDRHLGILGREELRVLDVGAGYGRLAHRMTQLVPGLTDYACIDAIPESTHACERYLEFRGITPPCRVIELPDADREMIPDRFDLAVNIHSFSEMPARAARYWVDLLATTRIPWLLVVPNAPTEIRSVEADGRRIDLAPVFNEAGYELVHVEPTITDPAVQALVGVFDHFHLFSLADRP